MYVPMRACMHACMLACRYFRASVCLNVLFGVSAHAFPLNGVFNLQQARGRDEMYLGSILRCPSVCTCRNCLCALSQFVMRQNPMRVVIGQCYNSKPFSVHSNDDVVSVVPSQTHFSI